MHSFDIREKIFVFGLSFAMGCPAIILGMLTNHNYVWFGLLFGILCTLFLTERGKIVKGEEFFWGNFTVSDKFIYSLDIIILLTSVLYPIKENLSIGILLLYLLTGIILTWAITGVFGSKRVKRKILLSLMK